jgi:hypothetical protein
MATQCGTFYFTSNAVCHCSIALSRALEPDPGPAEWEYPAINGLITKGGSDLLASSQLRIAAITR